MNMRNRIFEEKSIDDLVLGLIWFGVDWCLVWFGVWFSLPVCLFVHLFVCSFVCLFVCSFICSCVCLFVREIALSGQGTSGVYSD